jgi:hypothetical protein
MNHQRYFVFYRPLHLEHRGQTILWCLFFVRKGDEPDITKLPEDAKEAVAVTRILLDGRVDMARVPSIIEEQVFALESSQHRIYSRVLFRKDIDAGCVPFSSKGRVGFLNRFPKWKPDGEGKAVGYF